MLFQAIDKKRTFLRQGHAKTNDRCGDGFLKRHIIYCSFIVKRILFTYKNKQPSGSGQKKKKPNNYVRNFIRHFERRYASYLFFHKPKAPKQKYEIPFLYEYIGKILRTQ